MAYRPSRISICVYMMPRAKRTAFLIAGVLVTIAAAANRPIPTRACSEYESYAHMLALAQPILPIVYDYHGFTSLFISDGYAYCTTIGSYELQVVDVRNALQPRTIAALSLPSQDAQSIAGDNHYAYVANGSSGIQIADVSSPGIPRVAASVSTRHAVHRLTKAGNLLLVGCADALSDSGSLVLFDVSEGDAPGLLAEWNFAGQVVGLCMIGRTGFAAIVSADGESGRLAMVACDRWQRGADLSEVPLPEPPASIAATSGQLAVGGVSGGVYAYAIGGDVLPRMVASCALNGRITCIEYADAAILLVGVLGEGVVALRNDAGKWLASIGALPSATSKPTDIEVVGNVVYVVDCGDWYESAGLVTGQLNDQRYARLRPMHAGVSPEWESTAIEVDATYLYSSDGARIDICNPAGFDSIQTVSVLAPASYVREVAVGDGWLIALVSEYSNLGHSALLPFDIHDVVAPVRGDRLDLGSSNCHICSVGRSTVALSGPDASVSLYAAQGANAPLLAARVALPARATALGASNSMIAVATEDNEVILVQVAVDGRADIVASAVIPGHCSSIAISEQRVVAACTRYDELGYIYTYVLVLFEMREDLTMRCASEIPLVARTRDLDLSGASLYVVGDAGMFVFDVSDQLDAQLNGGAYSGTPLRRVCATPWGIMVGDSNGRVLRAPADCIESTQVYGATLHVVGTGPCHIITGTCDVPTEALAVVAEGTTYSHVITKEANAYAVQGVQCARYVGNEYVEWYSLWGFEYASGWRSLTISEAPEWNEPEHGVIMLRALPNPSNSMVRLAYSVGSARCESLVVYDVRGRRVVDLTDLLMTAGAGIVPWNLNDSNGRRVGSGLYLARLRAQGSQATARMVVLD